MKKLKRIGLILLFLTSCYTVNKIIPEERKKITVATIINPEVIWLHGNTHSDLTYNANGKKYNCTAYYLPGRVKDEKFLISYDTINPSQSELLIEKPIFLDNERTKKTVGTIKFPNRNTVFLEFEYYVDNVKFHKTQILEKNKVKNPGFKKGEKYEVEYWEENPQRSIIHIDKPITDSILHQLSLYGKSFYFNEKTAFISGTIINLNDKSFKFVTYTYTIAGKEYQAFQDTEKSIDNYAQLVNGANFKVEYSIENPKKSIIYIEKPFKDSLINTK
jgi:hypothetical protein